jgi:hypothetical protein
MGFEHPVSPRGSPGARIRAWEISGEKSGDAGNGRTSASRLRPKSAALRPNPGGFAAEIGRIAAPGKFVEKSKTIEID